MGVAVDVDLYARVAGHFRRACETLGIKRRKRDLVPHPLTYAADFAARKAAAEEAEV
jgi:hypothetical protein